MLGCGRNAFTWSRIGLDMDSKFVIDRGDADIAGFKHTVEGVPQKIWCAECAIADDETPPFIANETELDLPPFSSLEGSVGPVVFRAMDQYAEFQGEDPEMKQDLSDTFCDECGQSLQPE